MIAPDAALGRNRLDLADLFIGGAWVAPATSARVPVVNPATEEVIGSVPEVAVADVDAALESARAAMTRGPWPRLAPTERCSIVQQFAIGLAERAEALIDVLCADVGLTRKSLPNGQIAKSASVFDAHFEMAGHFPWSEQREGSGGRRLRVDRRPVGVIAAFVPWNAPLYIAALKLAPMLLSGNAVVMNASVQAPLYTRLVADAAKESGLPTGVLSILSAGPDVSQHLVGHPAVDHVSFTGSTAVGRQVAAVCGRDLRRCTLELGGKSAAVVLGDTEMSPGTVSRLLAGAMANSGQICAAQSRILVPHGRHDEIVDALAEAGAAMRVGDPNDPDTDMGPVISREHRDRIEAHVRRAQTDGARLVIGGDRPDVSRGWFVAPTVLTDVHPETPIARDEVFGPVATILTYGSDEEAIALANDSHYGLAGSVWSADVDRAAAVAERIQAGAVAVNSPAPLDPRGPFGGIKDSGIGREGGPEAFLEYTEAHMVSLPPDHTRSNT